MIDKKPKPIKAAGGVVYKKGYDSLRVLMIYRRGVWDLPKGKVDKGESRREAAIREVAEETGSKPPKIEKKLTETVHTYEDEWGYFIKTTYWYAMTTKSEHFTPESNEGIEKVCWVDVDRAMKIAGYDNLRDVLSTFKEWIN